ncbi:hypothetical protein J4466_01100 [Candidatus Pacearchaeota archaeon]|nr:hypothetical protein [Candidatus Pacearchaeota archaeon]
MANKKFLRRNTTQYLRLGKKRKKVRKWQRPKGRHSKMRQKRKGYPVNVSIGFRKDSRTRDKINGKKVMLINNLEELKKANNESVLILGKIGGKKKIEAAKIAKEKNLNIINFNYNKLLKKISNNKIKNEENKEKEK